MTFFDSVYFYVQKIPYGKVATYGQIATLIGSPHAARAVGYALHANPSPQTIPCYRVVNRFGKLSTAFAFGGINVQKELLEKEGIEVSDDNVVNLSKYRFNLE